ncbi:MAG TPA: ComF family protein, partial [Spirochaetales bacterium]|nr:ComF family protein [Spirochaetales bacterium]
PLCDSCAATLAPIVPPACPACGRALISEVGMCVRCRSRDRPYGRVEALYAYAGSAKDLVGAYKFAGRTSLAYFLADVVAQRLRHSFPGRVLIPVPPRPGKRKANGWDQVDVLATILQRRYGIVVMRVLKRRGRSQQKRLNAQERFANAARSYSLIRRAITVPADPVLLDDVITTGATLSACASILRAAGATTVDALALATD